VEQVAVALGAGKQAEDEASDERHQADLGHQLDCRHEEEHHTSGARMKSTRSSVLRDGRGVTRLTRTITAKPSGTPKTPAAFALIPHHRESDNGLLTPNTERSHGWVVHR